MRTMWQSRLPTLGFWFRRFMCRPVGEEPAIRAIMQDYAYTTGGAFVETASDGTGAGEGILDIIATCGGLGSQQCITRNAQFWFTHAYGTGASTNCPNPCANLLDAIKINGGILNLGFVRLPTTYRDSGSVLLDGTNALIEALGFYWKSTWADGRERRHARPETGRLKTLQAAQAVGSSS